MRILYENMGPPIIEKPTGYLSRTLPLNVAGLCRALLQYDTIWSEGEGEGGLKRLWDHKYGSLSMYEKYGLWNFKGSLHTKYLTHTLNDV